MSETITKKCDNCGGTGWSRGFICGPCDGSGRVPDIEATQRAQLDAQRILLERFDSQLRAKEAENAELRAEVTRLIAENTRLTAEVERLSQREPTQQECDEAEGKPDATGKTWPVGEVFLGRTCRRCIDCGRWAFGGPARCPYCAGKYDANVTAQMYLDDLRAANAEVERLEGREKKAATLFKWLPCDNEFEWFSAVSTWLAGCKP